LLVHQIQSVSADVDHRPVVGRSGDCVVEPAADRSPVGVLERRCGHSPAELGADLAELHALLDEGLEELDGPLVVAPGSP
jgi:hypothetical protein